jgi:GNAT superfamily N-acetyltransferase
MRGVDYQDAMQDVLSIRTIRDGDIDEVAGLVQRVFDQFIAPDYCEAGRAEFAKFLAADAFRQRFRAGGFASVACLGERIVGMIEVRDGSHVCLFFTAAEQQRQGIGRRLLDEAVAECRRRSATLGGVTVNAAPSSVAIYRRLGFVPLCGEQEANGIRFTPMSLKL